MNLADEFGRAGPANHSAHLLVRQGRADRVSGPSPAPKVPTGSAGRRGGYDIDAFFGDQTPVQLNVALVVFATATYTFYNSFLERAKVRIFRGDRLALVIDVGR